MRQDEQSRRVEAQSEAQAGEGVRCSRAWFVSASLIAARELIALVALAAVLGLISVGTRTDVLPWVADPSAAVETCELGPAPDQGALGEADAGASQVERISVSDAISRVGDPAVTFVDARSGVDYEDGHIPGALSLPAVEAETILAQQSLPLPVDRLVICYCEGRSCEQSEHLGRLLQDAIGCRNVRVLAGGWLRWTAGQGPVERGKVADHG
jgi:rhodanese-related sulfurtransferase